MSFLICLTYDDGSHGVLPCDYDSLDEARNVACQWSYPIHVDRIEIRIGPSGPILWKCNLL